MPFREFLIFYPSIRFARFPDLVKKKITLMVYMYDKITRQENVGLCDSRSVGKKIRGSAAM